MEQSTGLVSERRQLIRALLRDEWDPIGIGHLPQAHDEYDAYTSTIYELVISNKTREEIVDYLCWLETQQIGMPGDRAGVERFADRLLALRSAWE